jgi:glycosyltransferase involved in cell wall biosynthesis
MRVLWVARAPAPYRYPIWRAVAKEHELRVGFLHPHGVIRDWQIKDESSFDQVLLPAFGPRYREDALWTLRRGWQEQLDTMEAVVLQGAWETPAFWQLKRAARRRRIRSILFYEGNSQSIRHSRGVIATARSTFMRGVDAVVTPGPAASAAVASHGVDPGRIVESVNVVDVAAFHAAASGTRSQAADGGDRGHRYLVAAQLIERKNIAEIITAFADIRQEGDSLTIAGRGPLDHVLRGLATELRLDHSVQFVGHQSETGLQQLYAVSHSLVLASHEEVWGLVANEALASGMHVVVTSNCGVAASLTGMAGAFICPPGREPLGQAMAASRARWTGWIDQPQILEHDGDRFARDLDRALTGAGHA